MPAIRLLPADVVSDSVKQVRWTTNTFAVKWKYTEAGARKMVAFWMQHTNQPVCIQVGSFQTPPFVAPGPVDPLTHSDWRKDWVARRTDQIMNVSESDAKIIIAAMKGG